MRRMGGKAERSAGAHKSWNGGVFGAWHGWKKRELRDVKDETRLRMKW